ncbi:hypothetical protein [Lewinella sp. W8]|uniref:hypothetical protein n=1 Tax=Lewinella sp. W8 TaxID=2528208 RepID=UPI0010686F80|nr:hypothetical protein [Lewinella sp. W8]MTB53076.1 hypothetical protein [Lewinella sp. W8]
MSKIVRKKRDKPFVMIGRDASQDVELSWKARGILQYLLGLPDGWEINMEDLVKRSKKDGKASLRSGIHELIIAGYMTRKLKRKDQGGQLAGYDYEVDDVPVPPEKRSTDTIVRKSNNGSTVVRFSDNGKTDNGKPNTNKETEKEEKHSNKEERGTRSISDVPRGDYDNEISLEDEVFSNCVEEIRKQPRLPQIICTRARLELTKKEFYHEMKKWINHRIQDHAFVEKAHTRLLSGRGSFFSWVNTDKTRTKYAALREQGEVKEGVLQGESPLAKHRQLIEEMKKEDAL